MIDQEQRDFLASFQEPLVIEVDGLGATLFCHGSPRSDERRLLRDQGGRRRGRDRSRAPAGADRPRARSGLPGGRTSLRGRALRGAQLRAGGRRLQLRAPSRSTSVRAFARSGATSTRRTAVCDDFVWMTRAWSPIDCSAVISRTAASMPAPASCDGLDVEPRPRDGSRSADTITSCHVRHRRRRAADRLPARSGSASRRAEGVEGLLRLPDVEDIDLAVHLERDLIGARTCARPRKARSGSSRPIARRTCPRAKSHATKSMPMAMRSCLSARVARLMSQTPVGATLSERSGGRAQ